MPIISINGKTYTSPDEMPPELRETYLKTLEILHDADGNGIPDFLEGKPLKDVNGGPVNVNVRSSSNIVVGNKVYTSLDELPPEARLKYAQAVTRLGPILSDADGNGIPDILEGKKNTPQNQTDILTVFPKETSTPVIQEPPTSVIQEETTNFGTIAVILFAVLILLGALGVGAYLVISNLN